MGKTTRRRKHSVSRARRATGREKTSRSRLRQFDSVLLCKQGQGHAPFSALELQMDAVWCAYPVLGSAEHLRQLRNIGTLQPLELHSLSLLQARPSLKFLLLERSLGSTCIWYLQFTHSGTAALPSPFQPPSHDNFSPAKRCLSIALFFLND